MLRGLRCVRCAARTPLRYDTSGCAECRERGIPSALLADYDLSALDGPLLWDQWGRRAPGLWAYQELLPVAGHDAVSLSEGGTPLIGVPSIAEGFHLKDERRNPTGSFKDRFFSTAVSWAKASGSRTIAVASSGNAGVSAAAYAAAAGLDAFVVATTEIGETWRGLIELYGGKLVFASTPAARWEVLREHAEDWTVLTNTSGIPVSSMWVGIEGYKTLAYEIVREWGSAPDVVTVPVSRGDGFAGMWAGFQELHELGVIRALPRMVAVERHPSLSRALAEGDELPPETVPDGDSRAVSISSPQGTMMALQVIRQSKGTAVTCTDDDLRDAAARLGRAGVGVELSSAAGVVAVDELQRRSWLEPGERVVALATAHAANQPDSLPS